ncbi:MAG: LysE family translocator [Actinobacteria bacterium]|nr:LysE family translocator [Actinomycetota bacterium]
MPDVSTLALFSAAAVGLLVIPGPAVMYIVTRGIDQGRTAAFVSVLGIHVGTLVHITAAALGLSALLVQSALAFNVVKLAGAAYLILLGFRRLIKADDGVAEEEGRPVRDLRRVFRQGVIVNVLNPKTALFFFAFLPQFVDPARGAVRSQILLLGALFVALGIVSDGAYAFFSSWAAARLRRSLAFGRARRYGSGIMYVGLGLTAALTGDRTARS